MSSWHDLCYNITERRAKWALFQNSVSSSFWWSSWRHWASGGRWRREGEGRTTAAIRSSPSLPGVIRASADAALERRFRRLLPSRGQPFLFTADSRDQIKIEIEIKNPENQRSDSRMFESHYHRIGDLER